MTDDTRGKAGAGAPGVERPPLVELLTVALPAIVTMTSYTVMQFVDTLVVSRLGGAEVAAAGNGGIAAFVPASIMFGVLGVVNTYVSQHLGAGRPERGAAYAWNGLWMASVVWLVALLPFAAILPSAFAAMRGLFGLEADPAVMELEVVYGRILLCGMIFTIGARGIANYFYGLHRATVVMVSALVGNLVNVPVTIALVFGLWGLPEMGLAGAALGTVIGGLVEVAIPVTLFLSPRYAREYATRSSWRPSAERVREIWKIGWPAGAMFGNEIVCWWIFMSGLIAHFGMAHNTAGWIVLRYMHLSFMPAVGLSIAVTAVVGRQIGRGRRDLVRSRTWLGLRLTMAYMGLCALGFVVFRGSLIDVFSHPGDDPGLHAEVLRVGAQLLIVAAAFQVFDAMAITLSGALRGAGDTVWPGVATIVLSWGCIIGLGKASIALAPQLGSLGPWLGASAFIILLALALLWRFASGAWERIELVEGAHPSPMPDGGEGMPLGTAEVDLAGPGAPAPGGAAVASPDPGGEPG
jgi:MATE family multidrug resistance protein